MKRLKSVWILGAIVFLGVLLRFFALGQIPIGFTADEASQGYSAYSLLKTGKDEWGLSWPLTSFRAFADYRAPLQTYLIIPLVALFGLNEFAVRLPSAIFGVGALIAIYLLANELFPKKQIKFLGLELNLGHLAAFFLAISPWHIQFSRTALEANFASLLFPLGFFALLKGIKGKQGWLILAAVVLGLDLYSYLAAKLFVPLFLAAFLWWRRIQIKPNWRAFLLAGCLFLLLALPLYADALFGAGNTRGKDLLITNFSQEQLLAIDKEQYLSPAAKISPLLSRLMSNKASLALEGFGDNYLSYLSPTFWFSEGGRETTYSIFPGAGLLYIWMLPLIVVAGYQLIKNRHSALVPLALWLALAIIPAAITKEGYRPNRVGSLLGYWELFSAFGLVWLYQRQVKPIISLVLLGVVALFFGLYLNLYFFLAPLRFPQAMAYGYGELVGKIESHLLPTETVIMDKGDEAQIFVAFYTKLDPTVHQTAAKEWWPRIEERSLLFVDMLDPYSLGRYTFKTFNRCTDLRLNTLSVIRSHKLDERFKPFIVTQVNYPDLSPAFFILRYDPDLDPEGLALKGCTEVIGR